LIVGFDTEYQRQLNKDGGYVDNEVLSYQFYCMVCNKGNQGEEVNWEGLIIPVTGKVEDRLTLQEFISIAISKGTRENPKIRIPRDIFLVAHFTRADVPGFKDFKEDQQTRNQLNFDNIRNSFVNAARDIPLILKDTNNEDIKVSIKVRDSLHLAPTGKKSLEDVGEVLGFDKIKLDEDPDKDLYHKQNMKDFRTNHWNFFKDYSIKDAEICAKYTARMIRLYEEQTGKFKLPATLTAIGVDLILKHWKDENLIPLDVVGKEEVTWKPWDKQKQQKRTRTDTVYKRPLHYHIDLLTECFHGGRNEQFWFGPSYADTWYDYDLTSAYPTAMFLIGEANWSNIKQLRDTNHLLQQKDRNKFKATDMVFADIDFEFPEDVRFPCLPVRTETGILFPRKGQTSTHISEILLAQSLGCKIRLNHGIVIESKRHPRRIVNRPFDSFTRYCIDKRNEHPKKSLENLFWKELTNSTYGKTAQGLRRRRVYDLRSGNSKTLSPSPITNPAYSSFITAFCRGTLTEPPPTKVEGFSGLERLRRTVEIFSD
jgi:hypothetical protein